MLSLEADEWGALSGVRPMAPIALGAAALSPLLSALAASTLTTALVELTTALNATGCPPPPPPAPPSPVDWRTSALASFVHEVASSDALNGLMDDLSLW